MTELWNYFFGKPEITKDMAIEEVMRRTTEEIKASENAATLLRKVVEIVDSSKVK